MRTLLGAAWITALTTADWALVEFAPRHTWYIGPVIGLVVGLATWVRAPR